MNVKEYGLRCAEQTVDACVKALFPHRPMHDPTIAKLENLHLADIVDSVPSPEQEVLDGPAIRRATLLEVADIAERNAATWKCSRAGASSDHQGARVLAMMYRELAADIAPPTTAPATAADEKAGE